MVKRQNELSETIGEIKYSGEFDYEGLYLAVYNWFKKMGFDVNETYKHKMTSLGAEVELTFKGSKKVTEFIQHKIECEIKIWNLVDIEVVREGKKQKINKGRMNITLSCTLVLDYNSKFDKSELTVRIFNLIRFTILRKKIIIDWMGRLVAETYMLHTEIKKKLGMETAYSAWE